MERITIKQIAKIADVSPKTVSKALNDKFGVSEELRNTIKKLAQDYNYIPNMFGRGLQGRSTKTVGILISDNTSPSYSHIINGIESKAEESDYNIILCNSNESFTLQDKQIKLLIQKQVDGIILAPVPGKGKAKLPGVEELERLKIPFVLLSRNIPGKDYDCVKTDNIKGGYIATRHLIEKGHRSIIHITAKSSFTSVMERIEGYKKALAENNLPFDKNNIFNCEVVDIENGYETMLGVLKERRDFTAVFAFNDIIAYGIMKAVHECRLRIPSDMAIIGYDDIPYSQICLVPLTTIHQDFQRIGTIVMEKLLQKIKSKDSKVEQILMDPYLVERLSV